MSGKILLVVVCAALGGAAGLAILGSYKRELSYYEGLCRLVGELKRNISYRRDGAARILSAVQVESAALKKNIAEYVEFAASKADKPALTRGALSGEGYAAVSEFFCSLGASDGASQLDELEMYAKSFEGFRSAAQDKCKKNGPAAVKVCFLLGLGIGILAL